MLMQHMITLSHDSEIDIMSVLLSNENIILNNMFNSCICLCLDPFTKVVYHRKKHPQHTKLFVGTFDLE